MWLRGGDHTTHPGAAEARLPGQEFISPDALEAWRGVGIYRGLVDRGRGFPLICLCKAPEARLMVSYCSSRVQRPQISKVYFKGHIIKPTFRPE